MSLSKISEALKLENLQVSVIELQKTIFEKSTPKNVTLAIAALSSSYFLYKVVKFWLKKRKYRHIPGPPTKGILGFFTGNIGEVNEMIRNGKVMPDALVKWHETYGEVYKFQMFNKMIVVTSDKNAIREALITKNYPKDKSTVDRVGEPMGQRFLGSGLVTEIDNDVWKHRRAIFNPGFHRHVLMTFVGQFNQLVNVLSDKLRSKADNKTVVHLMSELNKTTLDAIALIAFGMNTDSISKDDSVLNAYLSNILLIAFKNFLNPFHKYIPSNFSENRQFGHMIRYIRKLGNDKILERIKAFRNNEHMPDDILSSILASYKDRDMDMEKMTDDFVTFFVAGQETTANTLSFCFLELGKNPEIVKKAREEIDRVLGERTEVTYQDVSELKYCSAIFKEALRLFPPAPQIFRYTPEDVTIQDFTVPKDTSLWISTYMNSRYDKYFKDPLQFKPERFLKTADNPEAGKENYVYLPFSLGPRNCIGQNFAQLEGVIVIAKLLQKFDLRLDPTQSFDLDQKLTLYPKDGTRVFVSLRA